MPKPVGGRGIKAPYESTHIRIPTPIKTQIEAIIEDYREAVTSDLNQLTSYQIGSNNNSLTSLEAAKDEAKKQLKSKKGKYAEVAKILSFIYGVEVTKEELES